MRGTSGQAGSPRLHYHLFTIVAGGFVNRADKGNGLAGFVTIDSWRLIIADRFDDILEVELMSGEIDRTGVIGAETGDFRSLHHGGFDFGVFGFFFSEIPAAELLVGKEGGTCFTTDIDFGGMAGRRPAGGGSLDDASGTIFEFKNGDSRVFDFDTGMGQAGH